MRRAALCGLLACLCGWALPAQPAVPHRPPAVPLVVNDPYFSIWSMSDELTGSTTKHWSEAPQPLIGLARIDGQVYRWMGMSPRLKERRQVEPMRQVSVEVTPLQSKYRFSAAGVSLGVTFFTPLFPDNLAVLSRPVTYLTWNASATDGKTHRVDLLLDVDPVIAVNEGPQPVTWGRTRTNGLTVLNVGSRDQNVLHQAGDRMRIDWGYFHLAVPESVGAVLALSPRAAAQFATDGTLAGEDDLDMPRAAVSSRGPAAHLAVMVPFGEIAAEAVERHILLAYTQGYAIEYLGQRLRSYWQRDGMTESAMLAVAEKEYVGLVARGEAFDARLVKEMTAAGGADYAYLTSLVFRQTIAAHQLVADVDGTPLLFSKENDSNGCIDTVDVTYPSSPFFLLFNPTLLKAQLEPVMRYAALPRWRFPFAPHDLGTFPLANGQVYGGGEVDEENQMPVEESGNLILMVAALGRAENDWDFARKYMPQLTKWAAYLEAKGLDPENQLSTDDFSGHLAHNTNLSLKAIEALGAFAEIARGVGKTELAEQYDRKARTLPARWQAMAIEGDHYKLAFDQAGTWSQKYNLVWDDLLGLHLFPAALMAREWAFYAAHFEMDGLPLDNRKTITKLDWEVWTATLSRNPAQFADLMNRMVHWADTTRSRVPTTDFYDTVSGRQMGFQARSVVGGIFIKALADPEVRRHWANGKGPGY